MRSKAVPEASAATSDDDSLPDLIDYQSSTESEADESPDRWFRGAVARPRLPRADERSPPPVPTPMPPSPPPVSPPCSPPGEDDEKFSAADEREAMAQQLLSDPALVRMLLDAAFEELESQGDKETSELYAAEQLLGDPALFEQVMQLYFPPSVTADQCERPTQALLRRDGRRVRGAAGAQRGVHQTALGAARRGGGAKEGRQGQGERGGGRERRRGRARAVDARGR